MIDIECDNCGNQLYIDDVETANEYGKELSVLLTEDGDLMEDTIPGYLVYKCPACELSYKFSYKDWEKRYRFKIVNQVMEFRKMEMFKTDINPYGVNLDDGIEFCGQCTGYDGEGNCPVGIVRQCTIRKKDAI
jgi:hypothetical protein